MENFARGHTRRVWALAGILFFHVLSAQAQCPQAGFTLPDTVCIGEAVNIANTSTGAVRYEWDFCSGDFARVPEVKALVTVDAASIPTNITTVFDGSNWFGFFFSRENNTLFRLDFGTDLNSTPAIVNVGVFGFPISKPEPLEFVKDGGNWYAFTSNFSFPSNASASRLLRLDFGALLTAKPDVVDLGNLNNKLLVVRSIKIVEDGGNYVGVLTNTGNGTLTFVDFGNSVTNSITPSNILTTPIFPGNDNRLISTSVIRECGKWYGITSSETNGKIYRLSFGSQLFSLPTISEIGGLNLSFPTLTTLVRDDNYYGLISSELGNVYVLDFGESLSANPRVRNLGDFGILSNSYGFTVSKVGSEYLGFGLGYLTKQVTRLRFSKGCAANIATSLENTPASISYSASGFQKITLKAYNASNDLQLFTDSIFVRPQATADFFTASQCTGQPVTFSAKTPAQGNRIASYSWDFGDGVPVAGASVQRTFVSAATYSVTLAATDICGKTVTNTQAVRISRPSVADFTFPAAACSNQTLAFADASTVFDDPTIKWQWNFGDGGTSDERNPNYTFTKSGAQTITLTITGQSGCQTNVVRQVNLTEGASVGFSISQICAGSAVQLKDETVFSGTGTFASRSWDFGDNSPASAEANPAHTYAQPGIYLLKLTVRNNLGCTVSRTQTVTIRQLPKAAFAAALACGGEPVQFSDASLANDGTIAQWQWDFGNPASGADNAATEQNPAHRFANPGTYQVKLRVTTDFGCSNEITQAVTVLAAPKAAFAAQADCNRREVSFTDQSQPPAGGSLTGWYWEFGDNSTPSTDRNPRHTYAQPGSYVVRLAVTAASRCSNTLQQTVAAAGIRVTIAPDTTVCAGTVTFAARTNAGGETITAWQWDFGALGKFTTAQPTVTVPADATIVDVGLTVNTESGCSASVRETIPVRLSPTARFFADVSAGSPLSYVFSNRSANASRYEWDFGDGSPVSNASNPAHTYASPGIFSVVLKSSGTNGCQTANAQTIAVGTGIRGALTVFPNPVAAGGNQAVRLAFSLPVKQPVSLEVLDLAGRSLQKTTIENTNDDLNVILLSDVFPQYAGCAKGIYLITLTYGQTVRVGRLMIL